MAESDPLPPFPHTLAETITRWLLQPRGLRSRTGFFASLVFLSMIIGVNVLRSFAFSSPAEALSTSLLGGQQPAASVLEPSIYLFEPFTKVFSLRRRIRHCAKGNSSDSSASMWPKRLMERYVNECSRYDKVLQTYLAKNMSPNPPLVLMNPKHGLGDRMVSVASALNAALVQNRPFRIDWPVFAQFFEPPCMFQSFAALAWHRPWRNSTTDTISRATGSCDIADYSCAEIFGSTEHCLKSHEVFAVKFVSRLCVPGSICKTLRDAQRGPENLNLANILGCSLRTLLQPRADFLAYKIRFREGSNVSLRSLGSIANDFAERYYVIGIHIRLGDFSFGEYNYSDLHLHPNQYTRLWQNPLMCALTLQSSLEKHDLNPVVQQVPSYLVDDRYYHRGAQDDLWKVEGRPVRFFLLTDAPEVRSKAFEIFGSLLITVDGPIQHEQFQPVSDPALVSDMYHHMANEWYILSLSEKLILSTTIFLTPKVYHHRSTPSTFGITSWAYGLQHVYYDGSTCVEQSFDTYVPDTNLEALDINCHNKPLPRPQPHLQFSVSAKAQFPQVWNHRGFTLQEACSLENPTGCYTSVIALFCNASIAALQTRIHQLSLQTHELWSLVFVRDDLDGPCQMPVESVNSYIFSRQLQFRSMLSISAKQFCRESPVSIALCGNDVLCLQCYHNAINAGLRKAQGKFAAYFPEHTVIFPEILASLVQSLLRTNGGVLGFADMYLVRNAALVSLTEQQTLASLNHSSEVHRALPIWAQHGSLDWKIFAMMPFVVESMVLIDLEILRRDLKGIELSITPRQSSFSDTNFLRALAEANRQKVAVVPKPLAVRLETGIRRNNHLFLHN